MGWYLFVPSVFFFVSFGVAAAVVGPAVLAVRWLAARRSFLVRGSLETTCVVLAPFVAAFSALVLLVAMGHEGRDAFRLAAPAVIGAAPWVAGEVLSGTSSRQLLSLGASVAASSAILWGAALALHPMLPIFAAAAAMSALGSAGAYLATRGSEALVRA